MILGPPNVLFSFLAFNVAFTSSFIPPDAQQVHLLQQAPFATKPETETSLLLNQQADDARREGQKSSLLKRRNFKKWQKMMGQLESFYKLHGHSLVTMEQNPELAKWCKSIRRNYRHQLAGTTRENRSTLSDEKLQELCKVNFIWNVQSFQWDKRFRDLCTFRAEHGHCNVPADGDLGIWVHNQKCSYRALLQGKPSHLTPQRLEALTSLGLFNGFQTNADVWNQRYSELQQFYQIMGHSNVPEDFVENYQLGQWVMNQRLSFKAYLAGQHTSLSPERIARLDDLDFRWNLQSYQWFSMLKRLRSFACENGHVRISTSDSENMDLRQWVIHQRHEYQRRQQGRPSSMTDQREQALLSVPHFQWKTKKSHGPKLEDWDELFTGIREIGIVPGMRPKQHWFEGQNRFAEDFKDVYTDDDLLELWNQEDDDQE